MRAAKICEIKLKKVPSYVNRQPLLIPLNAAQNGCGLSWQCLIFKWSIASSPRTPNRISILGTRVSFLVPPAHRFTSRLRVGHFAVGLALACMYYTNVYLGYETLLGSSGMGPGTCSSWLGVWAVIHLPHALQVTGCSQTSCVYIANIIESQCVHPGLFCVVFDPLYLGGS